MCIHYDHVLITIINDALSCTLYTHHLKSPIQMFIFSSSLNFSIQNVDFFNTIIALHFLCTYVIVMFLLPL